MARLIQVTAAAAAAGSHLQASPLKRMSMRRNWSRQRNEREHIEHPCRLRHTICMHLSCHHDALWKSISKLIG